MISRQGTVGRVFVARIEHGEDLLSALRQLAEQEKIDAGVIYVIGGVALPGFRHSRMEALSFVVI